MGTGCSIAYVKKFYQKSNRRRRGNHSDSTRKIGGDDILKGLDPMTSNGFGGSEDSMLQGNSAFPVYLPGTNTSLSQPLTEDLPELDSKVLPDLQDFPDHVRKLLLGRFFEEDELPILPLKEILLLVVDDSKGGSHLRAFFSENDISDVHRQCTNIGYDFKVLKCDYSQNKFSLLVSKKNTDLIQRMLSADKLLLLILANFTSSWKLKPPTRISESDFDEAVANMHSADDRETFHSQYLLDKNSVPPSYRLKPSHDSEGEPASGAPDFIQILDRALVEEISRKRCLRTELEEKLQFSLDLIKKFEAPCHLLIILSEEVDEETLVLNEEEPPHVTRIRQLLEEIKNLTPDENKLNRTHGDQALRITIKCKLLELVKKIVSRDDKQLRTKSPLGIHEQLYHELILQQHEIHEHLRYFRQRPTLTTPILSYLRGHQGSPLVVHGLEGRGKTAILAYIASICGSGTRRKKGEEEEEEDRTAVLVRFTRCSPETLTQEQILRSICEQWCYLYGEHPSLASRSITEHRSFFQLLLTKVNIDRPLVIIIDGLDQVEVYSGRSMRWLPDNLPEGVKIILGVRDGTKEMEELNEILCGQDEDETVFINVPNLELEEGLGMLSSILLYQRRCLTNAQLNSVRYCLAENPQPRYLHLISHLASTWDSSSVYNSTNKTFQSFVFELLEIAIDVFSDCSLPLFPCQVAICVISATKYGLSDVEMMELFSEVNDALSLMQWQSFKTILSPFFRYIIKKGVSYIKWNNDRYRRVCLSICEEDSRMEAIDRLLKQFVMSSQSLPPDMKGDIPLRRTLEETNFLCLSSDRPVRERFFSSPHLLRARISAGDPYDILEDIKLYRRKNPDDLEFDVLREVIQMSSFALRSEGAQLYSQIFGRLRNFFSRPASRAKYPLSYALFKSSASPIAPSLHGSSTFLKEVSVPVTVFPCRCLVRDPNKDEAVSLSQIFWIPGSTYRLATFSSEAGEIILWDARRLRDPTSSSEIADVHGMKILDHRRMAILGEDDGRLEVFDLEKGVRIATMAERVDLEQGVFIANSAKLFFALSKSRSHVIKLSTFSGRTHRRMVAGHDRYLCNLVVSENGFVCVCGDVLQKPYPLLIWRLGDHHHQEPIEPEYELRIPHHEFYTRMAAITNDGKYYVTAAKNLLDASPSFLIVYDTENGKKFWDKHCTHGVTAIELCIETSLILTALENAYIYVWTLEGGENKFILRGHSFSVDSIQMSKNGHICLTWDSTGRDRTIRLWNMTNGSRLAALTPDVQVTCCALSADGNRVAVGSQNSKQPQVLYLCHTIATASAISEEPTSLSYHINAAGDKRRYPH